MKTMQDFHQWLSSAEKTFAQQRLDAVTRLSRAQLVDVSGQSTWFIWHDDEPSPVEAK